MSKGYRGGPHGNVETCSFHRESADVTHSSSDLASVASGRRELESVQDSLAGTDANLRWEDHRDR
eukprot:766745-Hanusia_phi.AAC.7